MTVPPLIAQDGMTRGTHIAKGWTRSLMIALALLAAVPATGQALPGLPRNLPAPIAAAIAADLQDALRIYEDIHQHPELGFEERRTAATLSREMRRLGFRVTENVGGTGLVALYENGAGPVVMVRTELDALPLEEKTGLPYASRATTTWNGRKTFVAHSCGHDLHMATWLLTAKAMLRLKDQWRGTLMFVAQPDEEGDRGARAMLADGLFTRFKRPDFALALHVGPFAYGSVGYRAGPMMSSSDTFRIDFKGRGGHGAAPQSAIDPIVIAARFVVNLQTVISREKDPSAFGVATVGAIEGGTAPNIIPDHAVVRGTLRSYDPAVRKLLADGVRRIALASAEMSAAPAPEIVIDDGLPSVVNEGALSARLSKVLTDAFGDRAAEIPPLTASDDFALYGAAGVPSFYFFVGGLDPSVVASARKSGTILPSNHSPEFAPVAGPSLAAASAALITVSLELLRR
ncbi:amidohydrolase [Sphingomonas sp. UYAg733]